MQNIHFGAVKLGYLFVDRINGKNIICEDTDSNEVILNKEKAREEIKESDVIYVDEFGSIFVDKEKTHARTKEILNLRKKLQKINN